MRPIPVLFVICVAAALSVAQNSTPSNSIDKLNAIESTPSVRLDPYIRKALLRALSELEEQDQQSTGADIEGTSTVDAELLQTSEDATETLPPPKQNIQIHSFIVNGQSAFNKNSTHTTPAFVDSKISIISTTAGNVENQLSASLPTQAPFKEFLQTKESSVNIQQVRSIQSKYSDNGNFNAVTKSPVTTIATTIGTTRGISRNPPATAATTTTSTTTTTTTPRPTHNDDGENIEEVNKQDVQVFPAPLVAAFTVQQDAQGLPKKVIPLYQQSSISLSKSPSTLLSVPIPFTAAPSQPPQTPSSTQQQQQQQQQQQPVQPVNRFSQNDFVRQQLALQKQLEEKQRVLEEQLRALQYQQRQQEELLRKQQFLLQQKEAQRQQQIIGEQEQFKRINHPEIQRLPSNQPPANFQHPVPQKNHFLNQNNGVKSTQVSIQQSVPVEHNNNLAGHQQLPNREAVDFLLHLRNQSPGQFPLQENHIPQGIANFLQPAPAPQFNQFPNFNHIRPEDQFNQKQGNRVFRQESGVGNFGINHQNFNHHNFNNHNFNNQVNNQNFNNQNFNDQNVNRFNSFTPIVPNNRFFQVNRPHQNQYNVDAELKHLLVQNGLNTRSHEDLNIVSKVLALNHGVSLNNNISNRLPFDSRRHVRPV